MKSMTKQSHVIRYMGINLEVGLDSRRFLYRPLTLLFHCILSFRSCFWYLHCCLLEINPCMILKKIANFNNLSITYTMEEALQIDVFKCTIIFARATYFIPSSNVLYSDVPFLSLNPLCIWGL